MINTQYITDQIIQADEHPFTRLMIKGTAIEEELASTPTFNFATASGRFEPGGCISSSLSAQIYNFDGELTTLLTTGAKVQIQTKYRSSQDWTTIGTLYIADTRTDGKVITITAYDRLKDGDNITYSGSFPASVSQIISQCAGQLGISVSHQPAHGGPIQAEPSTTQDLTVRQALLYAMQISGNYARIDETGNLYVDWYDIKTIKKTYEDAFGGEFSPTYIYSGVKVGDYFSGNTGYVYTLTGNPFVSDSNASEIAQRLAEALIGLQIASISISVLTDPRLQPGDTVKVPFFGQTKLFYTMPITAISYRGTMRETITCEAASADELSDKRTGSQEQVIDNLKEYTDQQITEKTSDLFIEKQNGTGEHTTIQDLFVHGAIQQKETTGANNYTRDFANAILTAKPDSHIRPGITAPTENQTVIMTPYERAEYSSSTIDQLDLPSAAAVHPIIYTEFYNSGLGSWTQIGNYFRWTIRLIEPSDMTIEQCVINPDRVQAMTSDDPPGTTLPMIISSYSWDDFQIAAGTKHHIDLQFTYRSIDPENPVYPSNITGFNITFFGTI